METIFFLCAVAGGTVFVLQFVMTVIGFGADEIDFGGDLPDDLPDDVPDDIPDDISDVSDVHGSTWLFGALSFRTVVAALLFFGLAGMGSRAAGLSLPLQLLISIGAGAIALYSVHYLMQALYSLRSDGTVRIERAVGQRGTVYIPIPASHTGMGKIQIRTQGRIMEYAATTAAPERLKAGTTVEVLSVLSPMTLEVEPIDELSMPASVESGDDGDSVT